jgi:hypothetical protein
MEQLVRKTFFPRYVTDKESYIYEKWAIDFSSYSTKTVILFYGQENCVTFIFIETHPF